MAQRQDQLTRVHVLHGLSRDILRRRLQFVLQLLQVVQEGGTESVQWFRVVPSRVILTGLRDQLVEGQGGLAVVRDQLLVLGSGFVIKSVQK